MCEVAFARRDRQRAGARRSCARSPSRSTPIVERRRGRRARLLHARARRRPTCATRWFAGIDAEREARRSAIVAPNHSVALSQPLAVVAPQRDLRAQPRADRSAARSRVAGSSEASVRSSASIAAEHPAGQRRASSRELARARRAARRSTAAAARSARARADRRPARSRDRASSAATAPAIVERRRARRARRRRASSRSACARHARRRRRIGEPDVDHAADRAAAVRRRTPPGVEPDVADEIVADRGAIAAEVIERRHRHAVDEHARVARRRAPHDDLRASRPAVARPRASDCTTLRRVAAAGHDARAAFASTLGLAGRGRRDVARSRSVSPPISARGSTSITSSRSPPSTSGSSPRHEPRRGHLDRVACRAAGSSVNVPSSSVAASSLPTVIDRAGDRLVVRGRSRRPTRSRSRGDCRR